MNKPLCQLCQGDMKKGIKTKWGLALLLIILGIFTLPFGIIFIGLGSYTASITKSFWVCKDCSFKVERQRGFFRS